MNKITYGTIKRLKESEDIEVRVYDSEDAYDNDNYYVAEVLDKGVNVDEYCEGVIDKFENPYYVELVDSKGKVVGHTSGVDEDGNFLVEGVKKNPTEEYWDATEIARDLFVSLLRFDFGTDYRGNNYIITVDNYEAERFYAKDDKEAKEIYKNWKEAKDNGAVEYDFNNSYKKIVESKIEGIKDEDLEKYKKFVDTQLRDGAIDDPEYVKTLSKEEYEDLLVHTWMKDKDLIDMFREQHYKEDSALEKEDTELWVNGKIYWSGDGRDVDYNLLLDVADQATEEDGVPYDHEDVEVVKIEESLKEAEAEKEDNVDIEELARQIMSCAEQYDELMMNDEDDVFRGTQDSYAVEVFEQNLYDLLLYSGLFHIENFAQGYDGPGSDGKKLDELYSSIRDIVEDGNAFGGDTQGVVNLIKVIMEEDNKKKPVNEATDEEARKMQSIQRWMESNDFEDRWEEGAGWAEPTFEYMKKQDYNSFVREKRNWVSYKDRSALEDFDELVKSLNEAVNPNAGYIDFLKQSLGDTYKEEETDKYLIIRGMKDGKPIGALWYGRASKPQIYATFRSEEEREEYIKRFLNNKASDEEAKAKRRVEQKLTKDHNFKVGDIFYTSWGYDQTNIDFYEVVNVRGSRLDLRELRKETVGHSGTYDEVKPIPGDYASDKIITISARADGSVTRMSSFEYPSLWDGRPKHETNSYFGH